MHEHKTCEHELKYCKICDKAYCDLCGREWHSYSFTVSYSFITYNPYVEYGDGTIGVDSQGKIVCSHHD